MCVRPKTRKHFRISCKRQNSRISLKQQTFSGMIQKAEAIPPRLSACQKTCFLTSRQMLKERDEICQPLRWGVCRYSKQRLTKAHKRRCNGVCESIFILLLLIELCSVHTRNTQNLIWIIPDVRFQPLFSTLWRDCLMTVPWFYCWFKRRSVATEMA